MSDRRIIKNWTIPMIKYKISIKINVSLPNDFFFKKKKKKYSVSKFDKLPSSVGIVPENWLLLSVLL